MNGISAPISLAGSQLIMRTHPMVIIGGILRQNSYFKPPAEFLREFRERRAGRNDSPAAA